MPPPEAAATEAPPAEGSEGGGGGPQELIQQIDQMLGALAKAAGPRGAPLEAVRDAFNQAIEQMLAEAEGGGGQPTGPMTPEQGGSGARPVGPGG